MRYCLCIGSCHSRSENIVFSADAVDVSRPSFSAPLHFNGIPGKPDPEYQRHSAVVSYERSCKISILISALKISVAPTLKAAAVQRHVPTLDHGSRRSIPTEYLQPVLQHFFFRI